MCFKVENKRLQFVIIYKIFFKLKLRISFFEYFKFIFKKYCGTRKNCIITSLFQI